MDLRGFAASKIPSVSCRSDKRNGGAMKNGNAALSSTLHTGGIRAMLDNAHAGLGGTRGLSDEVKAYIASHFQA